MKTTLQSLLVELNHGLVERDQAVKAALLTVLARENMVLIGPPGTGKSMIARRLSKVVEACVDGKPSHFEYLLTKFSTPEEIFGPLSITALKQDTFRRNTAGYLPTVRIAFLDEIFKASSSILNALLTILNERTFHNGAEAEQVPLQALIAASNELPADQEELGALYDRFLVRCFVDYVARDKLVQLLEQHEEPALLAKLSTADLARIETAARAVTIPDVVAKAVQRIWIGHEEMFKEDRRERLSDRRFRKAVHLMRVSAASNDRVEADLSDVFLLKDCLWNHPDNAVKVRELIIRVLKTYSLMVDADVAADADTAPVEQDEPATRAGTVIPGLEGRGTARDPFLVAGLQDLIHLARPEARRGGHHFRQSADIDCRALNVWNREEFDGHYDGGGHTIRYKQVGGSTPVLFTVLRAGSSVANLVLDELSLAGNVDDAIIHSCSSNADLIRSDAYKAVISACNARHSIVGGAATLCRISRSQSGCSLIRKHATECSIADCLVNLDQVRQADERTDIGAIASTLKANNIVERCFVTATIDRPLVKTSNGGTFFEYQEEHERAFSGIGNCFASNLVRDCAIGKVSLRKGAAKFKHPIGVGDGKTENNVLLDNGAWRDLDQDSCRSLSSAVFNQRYLESALRWDFKTVWQWDDAKGRPFLRASSADMPRRANPGARAGVKVDLLQQQIGNNIWI